MASKEKIRRVVWTGAIAAVTATGVWYGAGLKIAKEKKQVCLSPTGDFSQSINECTGDTETPRSNTGRENSTTRGDSRRIDCEEDRAREKDTRAGDEAKRGYTGGEYGWERTKEMKLRNKEGYK